MKKFRVQKYNPHHPENKQNIQDFDTLNEALSFVNTEYDWKSHETCGSEHYFYLSSKGYGEDEIDVFEFEE